MTERKLLSDDPLSGWQQLSSEIAYENPWIRVREDQVIRPDGRVGVYGVVETKAKAVSIVATTPDREICIIREYRYPVHRFSLRIPMGGAGHANIDTLNAAKEELREEAALRAERWSLLGVIEPMNGLCSEAAEVYWATELSDLGKITGDEQIVAAELVPFRKVLGLICSGEINDGQSIAAITLAATRLEWI